MKGQDRTEFWPADSESAPSRVDKWRQVYRGCMMKDNVSQGGRNTSSLILSYLERYMMGCFFAGFVEICVQLSRSSLYFTIGQFL